MKIEEVIFAVGLETRKIRCFEITADSGEKGIFWQGKLYTSTLPIIVSKRKSAYGYYKSYKRECPGKRFAEESIIFWEAFLGLKPGEVK